MGRNDIRSGSSCGGSKPGPIYTFVYGKQGQELNFSAHLYFNLLLVLIKKTEFCKVIICIWDNKDLLLELASPLCYFFIPKKTFGQVFINNGVNNQGKIFMLMCNKIA